jgi:hypothetical protein
LNNERDEILTILMEESAEVTVESSKIIRFNGGFDRLEAELGDMMCMMELLVEKGYVKADNIGQYAQAKRMKLKKWSDIKNL